MAYEMRISDWSSDVCASDLRTSVSAVLLPQRNLRSAHRRLLRLAAQHFLFCRTERQTPGAEDDRMNRVLNSLPVFVSAVEMKSMTKAAAAHNMSQSMATRHIQLIERELNGVQLLQRSRTGVTLKIGRASCRGRVCQ